MLLAIQYRPSITKNKTKTKAQIMPHLTLKKCF